MLREMSKLVPGFRGPQVRVRCFGHVLNLVVKAVLSQFTEKKRASKDSGDTTEATNAARELVGLDDGEPDEDNIDENEDEDKDDHEGDASREAADAAILDTLDNDNPELVLTHAEISAGLLAYEKIMKLSKKVWNSPTIRTELAQLSAAAGLDYEVLIRPGTASTQKSNEGKGKAREDQPPSGASNKTSVILEDVDESTDDTVDSEGDSDMETHLQSVVDKAIDSM
ncbi:uncharacterized protein TRAVEDRAFT_20811 [Trametes versicolor FP-101664 SS1]|uniref:uncharacterized protein n=1 Tax=Trametes versicolor (strain FP-101664) TaxID=717944 RepID=UPI00046215D9|nr:uncharacterized protein TRAVEDRAFT_20811 [Trametes versicolor FP-101664 SS1]EIW59007.1 hypothetical protein TRAVEDRAFT_20811 [Trametes versicolor FP-101664 SS1]